MKTEDDCKIPPYLKQEILLELPALQVILALEDIQPAVEKMKEWGFEIRIGDTVGAGILLLQEPMSKELKIFKK